MKRYKTDEEILLAETKEDNKKEPSGKGKPIILTIVAFLLLVISAASIYLSFFSFPKLRDLGYKNKEIYLIAKSKIANKVEEYNPCLLYSLNSGHCDLKKADYYLLFNGEFDYTECINALADLYSVDEIKQLQQFLTDDQIMQISVSPKANNIANLQKCYQKEYTLQQSIELSNSLNDYSINTLLTFDLLDNPNLYIKLLEIGYSDVAISKLYDKYGKEDFERMENLKFFAQLEDLLSNRNFEKEKLARYLMYIANTSENTTQAIIAVNKDEDVIPVNKINFSSFYKDNPTIIAKVTETTLINKANKLADDYKPDGLVDVDPVYRANNHQLVENVAKQFVEFSKACKEELKIIIVAYNGCISSEDVEKTYNDLIKSSKKITTNNVDAIAPKPNYSENQTGYGIDVASKYSTYSKFIESQSYDWVVANAHRFGFIQRYPEGKEYLTGYGFQAYHFRYVGVDAATMMHNNDWTMEEYCYLFN